MAASPQTPWKPSAFRAPPPSPVAAPRRIPPTTDDEFSGYLKRSRRVPELILPYRLFRRAAEAWISPEIELMSLISPEKGRSEEKMVRLSEISRGCFRVANHGIEEEVEGAEGGFRLRSPVAGNRNLSSIIPVDDDFSGYLKRSRRVPELILPYRLFRRAEAPWIPPEIDFVSLISPENGRSEEKMVRSPAISLGCFQIANHGIEAGVVLGADEAGNGGFRLRSPVVGPRNLSPIIPVDDEFSGYIKRSRRVPELILPYRLFRREAAPWILPEIDFLSLISPENGRSEEKMVRSAASSLGCFQIANHGIEAGVILEAIGAAERVFRRRSEWEKGAERSPGENWGFEVQDGDDLEDSDEFFWWRGGAMEMAGVLDQGNFSDKMAYLSGKMKRIAQKIENVLLDSFRWRSDGDEMIVCIRKHKQNKEAFVDTGVHVDLDHDMLGAMIRNLGSSHALGLHLFVGASSFRVYSKQTPVLFQTTDATILITIGDQIQKCSAGAYRYVIGKPEYQFGEAQREPVSIAFLHSLTPASATFGALGTDREKEKIISISDQLILATFLLLLYHIILYVC